MENTMKMYITADEVAELLGVSRGYAYKVIRGLNDELKAKGFRVISGKVPRKYFQEKYYGMVVQKKEGMKICRQQETENYGAVSFIKPDDPRLELYMVLKELNVKMYSSELYDNYMNVVDATDKKLVEEQNVNYYNNEKHWNRSG